MLLSDLFDQLTYGELSTLSMGSIEGAGLQECDYPKIIPHINLGLAEIYKRFPIKIREVDVQQDASIQTYFLQSKYAVSNLESVEPIKYIIDTPSNPFTDTVLRIESIFNADGEETRFTDDAQEYSQTDRESFWLRHTPSYDAIYLPYPEAGKLVHVYYRASHPVLETIGLNPYTTEVDIPVSLLEALLYFIASRILSNINTDGTTGEGNNYMMKFEASCRKVQESNVNNIYNNINNKLDNNGWV